MYYEIHIQTVLIIISAVFLISLIVINCSFISVLSHLKRQMNEQSRLIYTLWKLSNVDHDRLRIITDDMDLLLTSLETINTKSETTSQHYPTPDEADQIDKTIKEQLATEILLSQKMRSSKRESVTNIVLNTCQTYPDINVEYIVKKAISIIEAYTENHS